MNRGDELLCSGCGSTLPPGSRFCRSCGTPAEVADTPAASAEACPSCGAVGTSTGRFCRQCGAEVGASVPASTSRTRVDSNPVVGEVRDVAPQQPGRGSSSYRRPLRAVAAIALVLSAGLAGYAAVRFNPWIGDSEPRPAERAQAKTITRTTTRERRASEASPAPGSVTPTGPAPAPEVSYEPFSSTSAGYQTEVPSSWSFDQKTTDDGLYRSTWSGPDGTELLIDATPTEPPTPPPNAGSPNTVMHPIFGSAEEYVFSGGSLPQCAERCVLYQMVDDDGGGYAVLAGGGGLPAARQVARHAALELAPYDD